MLGNHVKIIYASASGNVEIVCEKVAEVLGTHNYTSALLRAEVTHIDEIISHQLFIFASSTWFHGDVNPHFRKLMKEMKDLDFKDKYSGFIGLGDRRYEPVYFCTGIDAVKKQFRKNHGKQIEEILKIDGEPYDLLDTVVTEWTHKFVGSIQQL